MAIPFDFGYRKPKTLAEAMGLKAELGKSARWLAGGTDVANEIKQGYRVPELLIDIKGLPELQKISRDSNQITIGALVTFTDILESQEISQNLNILYEAAGLVASSGIRNRATLVGNICSAVACMDSAAPLLVHNAQVHLLGARGERVVAIAKWFVENRKTAIADDELVTHVSIPIPEMKYAGAYQKMKRYAGEDLSQANVGVLAMADKTLRVAFGSVGPIPKRSPKIESFFAKKGVSTETITEAASFIAQVISPITDVRATREYRMHMTQVMFVRAVNDALERLKQPKLISKGVKP